MSFNLNPGDLSYHEHCWSDERVFDLRQHGFPHVLITERPDDHEYPEVEEWMAERVSLERWTQMEDTSTVDIVVWGFKDPNLAFEFRMKWM